MQIKEAQPPVLEQFVGKAGWLSSSIFTVEALGQAEDYIIVAGACDDGTLLDHSLVLYGSSLSDGNQHNFSPLPIVVAGGASGRIKGGRHLVFPKDTHMSNLLVAMLDTMGAPTEKFGDSTGRLTL